MATHFVPRPPRTPLDPRESTRAGASWHRPLLWTAVLLTALSAVLLVGVFLDPDSILGAPALLKPLKFSISIAIYCVTLSWLIGRLIRWRRLLWWLGTIAAIALSIEMVVIAGAALAGTTSHFNVSTPLATTIWAIMAASISIVWLAAVPVVILLLRQRVGDAAFSLSLRAGFVIALIGMALAFLMTSPTAQQLADYHGVVGAHTVGRADGGPGLPVLGWSTTAGDLRVPHFVGMHALQVLPLFALGLELLASRVPVFAPARVRAWLVGIAAALYVAVLGIVTAQALSGESIVHPSSGTVFATLSAGGAALVAAAGVLVAARSGRETDARLTATGGERPHDVGNALSQPAIGETPPTASAASSPEVRA